MQCRETPITTYIMSLPPKEAEIQRHIQTLLRQNFGERLKESMLFHAPTYYIDNRKRFSVVVKMQVVQLYFYRANVLINIGQLSEKTIRNGNKITIPNNKRILENLDEIICLIE